ncbi:DegT/DnrJ/EryC1/StrS family aminotransferase [Dichotomicrobium thermohalophilum]|uniref:dTDP-4-amino-4,6-dideoxygalactose transaminase n=1 Tax=Dichotomicrobium thermohalophilum TaxID=933063 RepID=A0A397Q6F3_9HYPH|nr:DegT/DnrJ/EryC1/StrS family aminotransferase [Dichotomicrobium thermohalophilum]RIA55385.1 dTDP-4-amino-4,6-dideoxygalactose transaminase [Dichotomicrobium thermohalophilum]
MRFLLSDIDMGEEEARAVADVVRSKWLSIGPRTAEFEAAFAEMMGTKHAVAVSSCTAALHLALKACGIGPGDEVLVPSYTFVASANAILYQGATPVFVDIGGPDDLNLDLSDLEARITPRTSAIIVVHLAGYAADMDRIMALADRHGLAVIEDACHAIGATYELGADPQLTGRKLGTIGAAGCFSFFANKNLVTGEGGMIVTDDDRIAEDARRSRAHGMTKTSWDRAAGRASDYDVVDLGYNYRGTEITAALGLVQLGKLHGANARRKALTRRYEERLADCPSMTLPFTDRIDDAGHHIMPIVLKDARSRTAFREALKARGIQTSVHYPPVHLFTHYRKRCPEQGPLPKTLDVAAREVTLPLHPLLSDADVDTICDEVLSAAGETEVLESQESPGG